MSGQGHADDGTVTITRPDLNGPSGPIGLIETRPAHDPRGAGKERSMRKRFLASVAALATSAGLAFGQAGTNAPTADPAAIPIPGVPGPGGVMPVVGSEALFLQGGPPDAWAGYGPHFGRDCNCDGCKQGKPCLRCGDGANQVHKAAGGPDCFFFDLESLYLYYRTMPVPVPLITAGPIGTTGRPGVEDGVKTLFGNENVDLGPHASLRGTIGYWDSCRKWGFEAVGFLTEQRAEVDRFDGPITGRTVLARPNINVLVPVPDSIVVASPPVFGGSAGIYTNNRVAGAEANILRAWSYYDRVKFNTLAGFRWLNLNEQLRIDSTSILPIRDPNDPDILDITDNFTTRNDFYGLNVGFQSEWRHGRWYADMTAKVAVGFTHEKLNIHGVTRSVVQGVPTVTPFGALALEPNSGDFSENKFALLPACTLKVGYNWTQRLSTYIGYDGMYLSRAVRPGNQINPNINPTLLPASVFYNPQFPFGAAQPSLIFDNNDFWLQGFTVGMSFRY